MSNKKKKNPLTIIIPCETIIIEIVQCAVQYTYHRTLLKQYNYKNKVVGKTALPFSVFVLQINRSNVLERINEFQRFLDRSL